MREQRERQDGMTRETRETIAIFEGLALSADEARRTIRAHTGADVVWEWRTGADDAADEGVASALRGNGDMTYHAAVTSGSDAYQRAFLASGESGLDALEDVLWDVVLEAMLAEDAPALLAVPQPSGRA